MAMSWFALSVGALYCLISGAAAVVTKKQAKPSSDLSLAANTRERFRTVASGSFVRSMEFKHTLRVCNAYPSEVNFDVYLGSHEKKLTESPLAYKNCEEFAPDMKAGDKLLFTMGGATAGSFAVSDLPNNDAVLMLVIYRHDTLSTAVAFESHVFANLINAQIAVLDTYKGATKTSFRIQDGSDAKTSRSEELRFDSVVAVNPGLYEVVGQNEAGKTVARQGLVALNRESYVVIRAGVEAQQGKSYPQEMMVFPRSNPDVLTGGKSAAFRSAHASVFAALAAVFVVMLA